MKHTIWSVATVLVVFWGSAFPVSSIGQVDFLRDVRPILSNKCYTCHGPDEQTREGGLRLDVKKSAFQAADSGEIPIVPGKPDQSELIRRILASDDEQMPPADEEKQLTTAEKQTLKKWIEQGATWQRHWAFEPVARPRLPAVKNESWLKNEIDQFVLAKLESAGKHPKPMANRETLIRRLSFDLTGLPPSPKQVDEFLNDSSSDAYEKLVDRLLATKQYGENMAARWMDAARFADTNGYQNDFSRNMWPWRDWVIQAYNDNKPFDEFVVEQIAGDMLPNATLQQKIATGFNRNHRTVTEGGSIEQEWLVENVVDRVETTATVFLGLTMGCARCHDHKYDPISQTEFYQFFAYFYNVEERGFHNERRGNVPPLVKVVDETHRQRLAKFDERIAKLKTELTEIKSKLTQQQAEWEKEFASRELKENANDTKVTLFVPGQSNAPESFDDWVEKQKGAVVDSPIGKAFLVSGKDNSQVQIGTPFAFEQKKSFSVSAWVRPKKFGAIISQMDAGNSYRGFDMLINPDGKMTVHLIHNWPRNAIKVTTKPSLTHHHWQHVAVTYDGSSKAAGVKIFVNGRPVPVDVNSNSLDGETKTDHPTWLGYRSFTKRYAGHITDLRIDDRVLSQTEINQTIELIVQPLVQVKKSKRSLDQQEFVDDAFRSSFAKSFANVESELATVKQQRKKFDASAPTTMVMKERASPRDCFVLKRGQYDQPDQSRQVFPATPSFLPKPPADAPKNRLGLARWLVDEKNPLTARVAVNRYWQQFFGNGLVGTPEDFGVQSPLPAHQELLDWLASEFVKSKWDVKSIQKKIVMSATYRQSSVASVSEYRADPNNEWLSRGPRFRLTSEQIRDNALAISGLLNRKIGGPSIKPYQPAGLWRELAGGSGQGVYRMDQGDAIYRRSLYIYRKRTVPPPSMTTFDAGSREICQVARPRTNTPLQALALLNDPTYLEAARVLAELALKEKLERGDRIKVMFRRATARLPSPQEFSVLEKAVERYRQQFTEQPELAIKYLQVGRSPRDKELKSTPTDLAAYTVVASTILNLDETVTRE